MKHAYVVVYYGIDYVFDGEGETGVEDLQIEKVFSTKDKADTYISRFSKNVQRHFDIMEFEYE